MKRSVNRLSTGILALASLACAVALVSCAANPELARGVEAERVLPQGALAYAKLDGELLAAVLESWGDGSMAKSAQPFTGRTDTLSLAYLGRGISGYPSILAIASGGYPAGLAAMGLRGDKAWVEEGTVFRRKDDPLRVSFAGSRHLLLGTVDLGPLKSALPEPGPHPVPEEWRPAWDASSALYVPKPAELLAETLPLDLSGAGLMALALSAQRNKGEYEATLVFAFATERSATVFSPLARLFLYGAARASWPDRYNEVLDTVSWTRNGPILLASGLRLSTRELAALFGAVGLKS